MAEAEMFRTFNMGIGMVVIVPPEDVEAALAAEEGGVLLGSVVEGEGVALE